jgi:glycerol-3-phosphate acyltransferase PlsY
VAADTWVAENATTMPDALVAVLLLTPLAYLLGTFPSAAIVARRKGVDIAAEGSGNPGASNTFRLLGWKAGTLVFALDAGKGALAAGVGLAVDGHRGAFILGGAAVLGHVWPVTRRFKGGKGVATGAGMMFVLFPVIVVIVTAAWLVLVKVTHKASLASVTVVVMFPILVLVAGHSWGDVAIIGSLALVVVVRHWSNLRRLARGEEHDVGGARPDTPN